MSWGRYWFTRREGAWCIAGPVEDMRTAFADGKPILVTRRHDEVGVVLTGEIQSERNGVGTCAKFRTLPDEWTPEDEALSPADRVDTVRCPACQAEPGDPCTQATSSGRRRVAWVHNSRRDLAKGWR